MSPRSMEKSSNGLDNFVNKQQPSKNSELPIDIDQLPEPPEGWTRCHVYLPQRRRFCRQEPVRGDPRCYCGNHQYLLQQEIDPATEQQDSSLPPSAKRAKKSLQKIPCPVDPTHWISADALDRHVLICPKAKQAAQQAQQPFYCKDCNAGGYGEKGDENALPLSLDKAKILALAVLDTHQRIFANLTGMSYAELQLLTLADIERALELQDLSGSIDGQNLTLLLNEQQKDFQLRFGGDKHIKQQASLLGHLKRCCLPSDHDTIVVEVGAGRGMMGLVAAASLAASTPSDSDSKTRLLMVERTGSRGKAEKFMRNISKKAKEPTNLRLDLVQWQRMVCDLQHFFLVSALDQKNEDKSGPKDRKKSTLQDKFSDIHVVGKHVCGAGTDLSLKSLEPLRCNTGPANDKSNLYHVQSCIMATCCHGVCCWDDYVGRDFLRTAVMQSAIEGSCHSENESIQSIKLGSFGKAEFECLRKWCAGSVAPTQKRRLPVVAKSNQQDSSCAQVSDSNTNNNDEVHSGDVAMLKDDAVMARVVGVSAVLEALNLSCGVRGLGRACQRILDHGRLQYMRQVLKFDHAKLIHYVASDVTPQNAVLVAYDNL